MHTKAGATTEAPFAPRYADPTMCMQCAAVAAASVGTASGLRAWLGHHLSERGRKIATAVLLTAAVVASGVALG
jgi:hypothetical protein